MKLSELEFDYPEALIATKPARPSRVLLCEPNHLQEVTIRDLLNQFSKGDLLVINDTKVEPRRVFAKSESGEALEVLFITPISDLEWQVLFPASRIKSKELLLFPQDISGQLVQMGRPQVIRLNQIIDSSYFEKYGEMPLPPYIQKFRHSRHETKEDRSWYQTEWAAKSGSSAAPTASLHFSLQDFEFLKSRGVCVEVLTLHVGLGTYLPVTTEDLNNHKMHAESVEIPKPLIEALRSVKSQGRSVWALGTTATRALEALALGHFQKTAEGGYQGKTDLLIQPGFKFQVVDVLLTNFHQPQSTLLALVMGFASRKRVLEAYKFAIDHGFRLFSFGDLSVWKN